MINFQEGEKLKGIEKQKKGSIVRGRSSSGSLGQKQQKETILPHLQNVQMFSQQQLEEQPKVKFPQLSYPSTYEWPLFKMDVELINKFWVKRTAKDQNRQWFDRKQKMFFQQNMLRIGKNKKSVKGYFYRLTIDGLLMYFKKESDSAPKGYLQLTLKMRASLQKQKTKKNHDLPVIYLERTQTIGITLFDHQRENTIQLFDILKQFCIVRGYNYLYQQKEQLGQGSFASVYRIENQWSKYSFAAKTYFQEAFLSSQHKEKFVKMVYNEINVLKAMSHNGIMRIFEIYQEVDKLVLVMEYIAGGTLYSLLRKKKRFSEKLAATLLQGISISLNEMHSKRFVHRDLKLENIMIESKDNMQIKLVDFGFAEEINDKELTSRAGTPGFIAPEIFRLHPYTAKADVFSVGVIFFSIMTGKPPFKANHMNQIIELNRKCSIVWDNPIWQDLSPECQHLIKKMLEPKPADRVSCAQILDSAWIQRLAKRNCNNPLTNQSLFRANDQKSLRQKSSDQSEVILQYKQIEQDKSVEFKNDFSYNTNEMKSLYQKNSLRTLNSQKSIVSKVSQVINIQKSLSVRQRRPQIEINENSYIKQNSQKIKVKRIDTNFQELENGSFGDVDQQGRQDTFFEINQNNDTLYSISILKLGENIFNKPKKPI